MYQNQQHYQYQQQQQHPQQPPQSQNPPPNQAAPPPAPGSAQQPQQHNPTQPQAQGQYQGYSYPPPAQPQPQPAGPPSAYFANQAPPAYGYAVLTPQGYFYNPPPYQSPYAGQQLQAPPNTFAGPPYQPPPANLQPQVAPYHPQPYSSNGYSHPTNQQHPQSAVSSHSNTTPSKRQKVESRPSQPNANHNHKHHRPPSKEKKMISEFRVSRIKVGNFSSDTRDSRLRFHFRTANSPPSSRPALTPANIAAKFPDRLSVSFNKGTQRIVIPATHLTAVLFNRTAGYLRVEGDGWAAFEEVRADETKDSGSVTSDAGASSKFKDTDVDPTRGEWEKTKVMEIWLDMQDPLPEPKWAKGNLRDNVDPTSLFQNLVQFADSNGDIQQTTSLAGVMDTWRDRSTLGTVESRNTFVGSLDGADKLVLLLQRTVHMTHTSVEAAVIGLLALIPDKDSLHGELKDVIMSLPYEALWKALEMMMMEELSLVRHDTRSASVASLNAGTKRERESEHGEEMEVASNGRDSNIQLQEGSTIDKDVSLPDKDASLPNQSGPTSAVDLEESRETVSNAPTDVNILEEITGLVGDDLGMDLNIPDDLLEM